MIVPSQNFTAMTSATLTCIQIFYGTGKRRSAEAATAAISA